jgi:hypothetical protein
MLFQLNMFTAASTLIGRRSRKAYFEGRGLRGLFEDTISAFEPIVKFV